MFTEKSKTTISQKGDKPIQRKAIKIKDETSTATITIWSNKVTESLTSAYVYILIFSNRLKKTQIDDLPNKIINKTLQIRNGRINHYGGTSSFLHFLLNFNKCGFSFRLCQY